MAVKIEPASEDSFGAGSNFLSDRSLTSVAGDESPGTVSISYRHPAWTGN